MIYTVTFNPSLDYIVSVEDFKLGLTNRTSSELMLPGKESTYRPYLETLELRAQRSDFWQALPEKKSPDGSTRWELKTAASGWKKDIPASTSN